jgi:hypothetical protein
MKSIILILSLILTNFAIAQGPPPPGLSSIVLSNPDPTINWISYSGGIENANGSCNGVGSCTVGTVGSDSVTLTVAPPYDVERVTFDHPSCQSSGITCTFADTGSEVVTISFERDCTPEDSGFSSSKSGTDLGVVDNGDTSLCNFTCDYSVPVVGTSPNKICQTSSGNCSANPNGINDLTGCSADYIDDREIIINTQIIAGEEVKSSSINLKYEALSKKLIEVKKSL